MIDHAPLARVVPGRATEIGGGYDAVASLRARLGRGVSALGEVDLVPEGVRVADPHRLHAAAWRDRVGDRDRAVGPARHGTAEERLPTPAMRRGGAVLRAQVAEEGKPSRERFVVVALAEKGDFDVLQGVIDRAGGEAGSLEELLDERLARLPRQRWSKRDIAYTIHPR